MGATVVKPGESTTLDFPFGMGPGMGGPHHFQVVIKTNDPTNPTMVVDVLANAVEKK